MTFTHAARRLALLLPLAAASPATAQEAGGDPIAGEALWPRCAACHALDEARNGAGPHLVGLVGRPIGGADGFAYTPALAESDLVWNEETLAAYLLAPRDILPGTRKAGVLTDPQDIADVVAFLAERTTE
ncbi:c-type cytochrome [Jannaschia aquimarina]|uniref:Cytochrome c2 n=1 Tax=Jannaschia aquimarina TaxID=935700 RepID=A0A0D1EN84_9RHOB|nr:c-type cytochrome [Jannaschia aquimarina]KIT17155.1 Cytochrome c2 precursor [Jannaschia aquimarina]SNT17473.1 cytochrome c [Jannaschia aquimarina]